MMCMMMAKLLTGGRNGHCCAQCVETCILKSIPDLIWHAPLALQLLLLCKVFATEMSSSFN